MQNRTATRGSKRAKVSSRTFQNPMSGKPQRTGSSSNAKTHNPLSNVQRELSHLKSFVRWDALGFDSLEDSLNCLSVLAAHQDRFLSEKTLLKLKNSSLEETLGEVFKDLQKATGYDYLYWFKDSNTLRLFKYIEGVDMQTIHVLYTKPFFEKMDSFSKETKNLILSFFKTWFSHSFFELDYGISEWFIQMQDEEIDYHKKAGEGMDEDFLAWYEEFKSVIETLLEFETSTPFKELIKSFSPTNPFEKSLLDILERFQNHSYQVYWEFLKYSCLEHSGVPEHYCDDFNQFNIQESNVDFFEMLFLMAYGEDDPFLDFYIQSVNDKGNNEYVVNSLYDYQDITAEDFGKYFETPTDKLKALPCLIEEFNDLMKTIK